MKRSANFPSLNDCFATGNLIRLAPAFGRIAPITIVARETG